MQPTARPPVPDPPDESVVVLELPFTPPLHVEQLVGHLVATAVPGVEEWHDGAYRRTLRLPHGHGIASLRPASDHVRCELHLADRRDTEVAAARCRWLLDLDADPAAIDDALCRDAVLAPLVSGVPGRRVPRTVDGAELALRTVLGQQVSTAAARTHAGRLVHAHGQPIEDPVGGLTHLFPEVRSLTEVTSETLAMPATRRRAFAGLVDAIASGDLDLAPDADRHEVRGRLAQLPGIGPWTIETIAMRALGDPDAFLPSDLGVRVAAATLGLPEAAPALTRHAERWRPWRAYAVQHLWGTGGHAINRLPEALLSGPAGSPPGGADGSPVP
jgi:AraC family transcriptional regulator, regulatory protein of adaptative response / DNA-3-methyladenine glycosylase II